MPPRRPAVGVTRSRRPDRSPEHARVRSDRAEAVEEEILHRVVGDDEVRPAVAVRVAHDHAERRLAHRVRNAVGVVQLS